MENNEYPIFFMRENHTFKQLSADVDVAVEEIDHELSQGWHYGSLCTKRPGSHMHFFSNAEKSVCLADARKWLTDELEARRAAPAAGTGTIRQANLHADGYAIWKGETPKELSEPFGKARIYHADDVDAALAARAEEARREGYAEGLNDGISTRENAAEGRQIAIDEAKEEARREVAAEIESWKRTNERTQGDIQTQNFAIRTMSDTIKRLECQLAAAQRTAGGDADYTVDDSELARKIMVFLGRATSGSMEPGADPLRDRLAERLALWRPAAQPVEEVAAQADGAGFDECGATGQSCQYGPHGMKGETQCRYCGAAPTAQLTPPVGDVVICDTGGWYSPKMPVPPRPTILVTSAEEHQAAVAANPHAVIEIMDVTMFKAQPTPNLGSDSPSVTTAQAQPTPPDDERAAFEKWYAEDIQPQGIPVPKFAADGGYVDECTQEAWQAWQARAALCHPPVPNVGDTVIQPGESAHGVKNVGTHSIALVGAAPNVADEDAVSEALEFAARTIELYDEATMEDNYMIDSDDAAAIVRALKGLFAVRAAAAKGEAK